VVILCEVQVVKFGKFEVCGACEKFVKFVCWQVCEGVVAVVADC